MCTLCWTESEIVLAGPDCSRMIRSWKQPNFGTREQCFNYARWHCVCGENVFTSVGRTLFIMRTIEPHSTVVYVYTILCKIQTAVVVPFFIHIWTNNNNYFYKQDGLISAITKPSPCERFSPTIMCYFQMITEKIRRIFNREVKWFSGFTSVRVKRWASGSLILKLSQQLTG